MDKKMIQRKRMERYLIEAAKKIIEEEGTEAVTVRKVADLAGYSYATMYNYFADLNELLWFVVADYLDEMVGLLQAASQKSGASIQGLKDVYRAYISYYLAHPAVYRFAFFQQMGEPPAEVAAKLRGSVLADMQAAVLLECVQKDYLRKKDIAAVGEMLTFFVHGMLLFFFSERLQLDKEEMFNKLDHTIDTLLQNND